MLIYMQKNGAAVVFSLGSKSVELKAFVDTIGIKSADLKLFHASDMFVGYSFEMWAERF